MGRRRGEVSATGYYGTTGHGGDGGVSATGLLPNDTDYIGIGLGLESSSATNLGIS